MAACSGAAAPNVLRVGRLGVDAVPSAASLLAALSETLVEAAALQAALGGVRNAGAIAKRVQRDRKFLLGRISAISGGGGGGSGGGDVFVGGGDVVGGEGLTLAEAQGVLNNLRGARAEMAACAAPGVVAIAQRFRGPSGAVEADVVAHGGATWVEVKDHELFGADSAHAAALREQLRGMLAAAADPRHWHMWRPPAVALFSPSPISDAVAAVIRALGVTVISGAADGARPRCGATPCKPQGLPSRRLATQAAALNGSGGQLTSNAAAHAAPPPTTPPPCPQTPRRRCAAAFRRRRRRRRP